MDKFMENVNSSQASHEQKKQLQFFKQLDTSQDLLLCLVPETVGSWYI